MLVVGLPHDSESEDDEAVEEEVVPVGEVGWWLVEFCDLVPVPVGPVAVLLRLPEYRDGHDGQSEYEDNGLKLVVLVVALPGHSQAHSSNAMRKVLLT